MVCPSCESIYEYNDYFEVRSNGQKGSKCCQHVHFPNHPHASRRKPCESLLLKKVKTKRGYILSPIKVYPYKPLKTSIKLLVRRKGFLSSCEKWRIQLVPDEYLCDRYDGDIWAHFNPAEGAHFRTSPYSWLLTLNVEWFEQDHMSCQRRRRSVQLRRTAFKFEPLNSPSL